MTNAEHIVTWIENSTPHYKRLIGLKPEYFIREQGRAMAAFSIVYSAMRQMDRDYTAKDICEAAALLCDWRIK